MAEVHPFIAIGSAVTALLLSGCDTLNGVSRESPIRSTPDWQALKTRLESYPEITRVDLSVSHNTRHTILLRPIKSSTHTYAYRNDSKHIYGNLQFTDDEERGMSYCNSLWVMNQDMPQEWVDAVWPVMKRIENDLRHDFGMTDLGSSIKVRVHGVRNPENGLPPNSP